VPFFVGGDDGARGAQLGALAPLIDWTRQMAGFWQSRFDQLEDLLKGWTNEQAGDRSAFRHCRT
jgi:hypothetical protein